MRAQQAKERYPKVDPKAIDMFYKWGPGNNNHALWMVRMVSKGEDPEKVLNVARDFWDRKERLPKKSRDLTAYKTLAALQKAVNEIEAQSGRQKRKSERGYKRVLRTPEVDVYHILNYEGMRFMGRDTTWCLVQENDWQSYKDYLIFVIINKTKERRGRFSKFALLLDMPFHIDPEELLSYERICKCADALDAGVSDANLSNFSIYDERDRYDGSSGARAEILRLLVGEEALMEALLPTIQKYVRGGNDPNFRRAAHALARGEKLPVGEFVEVASLVAEHKLFNVLSLFHHPKMRTKLGRSHVWSLRQEALDWADLKTLAKTPAVSIPEFVEMYLDEAEWQNQHARMDQRYKRIKYVLGTLMRNSAMTQETKEIAMNWFGRCVFRMDDYSTDFKKKSTP
jgi:hypothetical protein